MANLTTGTKTLTVGDFLDRLRPGMKSPPFWPPDAFAIASSLLKRSGAYVNVVNEWPPKSCGSVDEWEGQSRTLGNAWRDNWIRNKPLPKQLKVWWQTVASAASSPITDIISKPKLVEALVGIVAAADEACSGIGIFYGAKNDDFDDFAFFLLSLSDSLCDDIHPSRCVVLPKLHNPLNGMTIRSLTHNIALCDSSEIAVSWRQLDRPGLTAGMNILLVPWPLRIEPKSFREADPCGERMPTEFGLFTFDMSLDPIDPEEVYKLVHEARSSVGSVDAVIFPELRAKVRLFLRKRVAYVQRTYLRGSREARSRRRFNAICRPESGDCAINGWAPTARSLVRALRNGPGRRSALIGINAYVRGHG